MKVGIIDCGTNTFNLLIAEKSETGWSVVFENKLPVKLGAGGFDKKMIVESRFIRGIDALMCHKENAANFGCTTLKAIATSAIREAKNRYDFMRVAKQKLDLDIELIDGHREAELIWKGIKQTIDLGTEASLIIDIGGGSTEFIIANATEILWKESYLLGVSRLHEMIHPDDKMSADNVDHLQDILDENLASLKEALKQYPCKQIVGSSGSFDTLYAMYKHSQKQLRDEPFKLLNEIPVTSFPGIHGWLINSTYEQRLLHKAIPSIRAEYMPLASYLVKYVLELSKFEKMYHSQYALKEGAAFELLEHVIVEPKQKDNNEEREETALAD